MPLLTLMERSAVTFDCMDIWENNDQGCEIMFRHLECARAVARNADTYTCNAQRILKGESGLQVISGVLCFNLREVMSHVEVYVIDVVRL